jgi:membrane-associated phospholipid phosphatase
MSVLGRDIGEDRIGTALKAVPKPGPGPREPVASAATDKPARSPILLELAWLVFLVWIYDWLQDLAPLRRTLAFHNAHSVLSFETRLGIDPERALDHWLAHQHVLAFMASNFYSNAIFAVTFGFAAYLWWCRPDIYRPLRNDLVLANLIGFVVFWAFPVAPPRMLPGFVDVVVKAGGLGAWHDTLIKHADQFAAMPSMHLGYAVWCSLVAWRLARHRASKQVALAFGIGYALLTALVVIATGNHYLLDVLAGTATVVVAVVVLEVLPGSLRRRLAEAADAGAGPAVPETSSSTTTT